MDPSSLPHTLAQKSEVLNTLFDNGADVDGRCALTIPTTTTTEVTRDGGRSQSSESSPFIAELLQQHGFSPSSSSATTVFVTPLHAFTLTLVAMADRGINAEVLMDMMGLPPLSRDGLGRQSITKLRGLVFGVFHMLVIEGGADVNAAIIDTCQHELYSSSTSSHSSTPRGVPATEAISSSVCLVSSNAPTTTATATTSGGNTTCPTRLTPYTLLLYFLANVSRRWGSSSASSAGTPASRGASATTSRVVMREIISDVAEMLCECDAVE